MALKSLPTNITIVIDEANQLREYAAKLNQIDIDKELLQIKNKKEKEKFKYRILEFKITYNKCVDKIQEIEKMKQKGNSKEARELDQGLSELSTIWQYIITTYKI